MVEALDRRNNFRTGKNNAKTREVIVLISQYSFITSPDKKGSLASEQLKHQLHIK
jgi:hypothetical protein